MAKKGAGKVTFDLLLAATGGGTDMDELENAKQKAESRVSELEQELTTARGELKSARDELNEPIRRAIRAARELNVEIPEKYAGVAVGKSSGAKSKAGNGHKYAFTTNGREPVTYSLSEAAWYYSKDCGGTNKLGRMTADELRTHIESETGVTPEVMELQDTVSFTLPNGKEYTMERIQ